MIALFDSGIGGLSVWREIRRLLPQIDILYFGDQAYAPYGQLTPEQIQERSFKIVNFLITQGINFVVIACNTATVNSTINTLRSVFPQITFVGVEPPVKPVALATQTGQGAILATPATCASTRLRELINLYAQNINLHLIPAVSWASLVESGDLKSTHALKEVDHYLKPLLDLNVDTAGLGCTHYPFLRPLLDQVSQGRINFIEIGLPVAQRVKTLLSPDNLDGNSHQKFITTSSVEALSQPLKNLLEIDSPVESIKL